MEHNFFINRLIELSQKDNTIIQDRDKSYSASQLYRDSINLANGLRNQGLS